MDVLSQLLEPIQLRGSVFCHGPIGAPWRFEGGAGGRCLFHAVVEGEAWLDDGESQRLGPGDIVLLIRGRTHRMGSAPSGRAIPLARAVRRAADAPFGRFETGGDGARSYLICGSFALDGLDWHPLLRELPDTVVVNASLGRWLRDTLAALERYVSGDEPGAALVTSRLAEILFVQVLGTWLERQELPDGWLKALRDPHIGRALALLHAEPGGDWSATKLAQRVGLSRSALFSRFKGLVGESPAQYLARWRMTLAARALRREDVSVAELCERLGYASVPSFTTAFRRHHGEPPGAFRRRARS